jgi:lysozyme
MMRISEQGLHLLKEWEGIRLKKYKDVAGKWTIGVGHLLTKEELIGGKFDNGITSSEAITLLIRDVRPAESAVNRLVKCRLLQHQFEALVSFVFNLGEENFKKSTLLRKLNAWGYDTVPQELRKWVYAGGKKIKGLINRRENEIKLWRGELGKG